MNNGNLPPNETRYDDLVGVVSVNFKEDQNFNSIASGITGYDPLRYEPVALRVFIYDHNPIVTLYAIDKEKHPLNVTGNRLQVKKFKREMSFEEIFKRFKKLNFTLTSQEYRLEDLEVEE
ncbi:MAG TPA: hypothetical protein VD908_17925 [Cytophagales bacterium]|nr:hypothetical protein [Cytophagales bacterium]